MATLAAASAGGNFTAAATWNLVHAGSLQTSGVVVFAWPTSMSYGASFAGDNYEIDGVALYIEYRAASPSGWLKVVLRNTTDNLDAAGPVTLNVTDLPSIPTSGDGGFFIFFKFASPVILTTGKNFAIGIQTQNASQVYGIRDPTANNNNRYLRCTTTQAPGAGDGLYIAGEFTGQGTSNSITVTMNNNTTDAWAWCSVSTGGKLTWKYDADTKFYLGGNFYCYAGGTVEIGTIANPIGSAYTAIIQFNCIADQVNGYNFVIRSGCTLIIQGNPLTYDRCYLNANMAAAATSATTDVSTGWKNGDDIAFAATDQTYNHVDRKTLNADANGTSLAWTGGASYGHSGISPTQAEVINLTRNIKFKVSNASYNFYWLIGAKSLVDIDWAELACFSTSSRINTTSGSCNIQHCAVKDCRGTPFYVAGAASDNITLQNNVGYNVASYGGHGIYISAATSGANLIFDGNWFLSMPNSGTQGFYSLDAGITCRNNVFSGCYLNGFVIAELGAAIGVFENNTGHSNRERGFCIQQAQNTTIGSGNIAWRNYGNTAPGGGAFLDGCINLTVGSMTLFGNRNCNLEISTGYELTLDSVVASGDTSFATAYGLWVVTNAIKVKFTNSDFGTATGIKVAHTTADIFASTTYCPVYMDLENTKLNSGAGKEVVGLCTPSSHVRSSKHNQVDGAYKSWFQLGVIEKDSTYYNTAAPSQRLTPNTHDYKLKSGMKRFAMDSGTTATVKVNVRKSSAAAGGADYNGNQPRLMCKAAPLMGIATDQVLDTMTAGLNSWEELSAVTPAITADGILEIYVDVDGDVGFVNVDDWSVV